jgi:hypothetical protein
LFVATASTDAESYLIRAAFECLDAKTGTRIWHRDEKTEASVTDLLRPITLFAVEGDSLRYRVGPHLEAVNLTDGTPAAPAAITERPATPPTTPTPLGALWDTSAFATDNGRLYAFTPAGQVYAVVQRKAPEHR